MSLRTAGRHVGVPGSCGQRWHLGNWVKEADIHPDSQRLMMVQEASTADRQIILVENWLDELQRLVPVP
jgi:hypothetical protein